MYLTSQSRSLLTRLAPISPLPVCRSLQTWVTAAKLVGELMRRTDKGGVRAPQARSRERCAGDRGETYVPPARERSMRTRNLWKLSQGVLNA